jgi:hypothetical protein
MGPTSTEERLIERGPSHFSPVLASDSGLPAFIYFNTSQDLLLFSKSSAGESFKCGEHVMYLEPYHRNI